MSFTPTSIAESEPAIVSNNNEPWTPQYSHAAGFPPKIFEAVIEYLIRNPNVNSTSVFRADILFDSAEDATLNESSSRLGDSEKCLDTSIEGFLLQRTILCEMIPRNPQKDAHMLQTCRFFKAYDDEKERTAVLYLPHASTRAEVPFYHPAVRGVAFLYDWDINKEEGELSVHYQHFPEVNASSLPRNSILRLQRTAFQLLSTTHRHGQSNMAGYVKRVHHDQLVPQKRLQDTYARLKKTYTKELIANWVEKTDPTKHVFEDLGIAAFLIELWKDLYPSDGIGFPGFIDMGCGNGLLVRILHAEGYEGWGFDARARKSWSTYPDDVQSRLKTMILIPKPLLEGQSEALDRLHAATTVHDGIFPPGSFLIANHPDELTGWTPILASYSKSSFVVIPCCSRNLSGNRFRANPRKREQHSNANLPSAYATLVEWTEDIAGDLGYAITTEILRIPSTRNTAIIGRPDRDAAMTVQEILRREGNATGWIENSLSLIEGRRNEH